MATDDATAAASKDAMAITPAVDEAGDEAMPDAPDAQQHSETDGATREQQASSQPSQPTQQEKGAAAAAAAAAAASAPPPPPPPPAGPRASRLQDLFSSSLTHTLAKISWANFAACYPTAAARNPVTLQAVHRAMVDRLRALCATEFAVILRNRDVVRRLNELEGLAADARTRREAATLTSTSGPTEVGPGRPPHTLPPETVLAAHLRPQRRAQRQLLEARLAAVQADNAARFAQLAEQQREAEQLVAVLERALADAARAAALLDGEEGEAGDGGGEGDQSKSGQLLAELARETRAAEAEMSGGA